MRVFSRAYSTSRATYLLTTAAVNRVNSFSKLWNFKWGSKINVDNYHKNNHSVFEYFNDKIWLSGPLKSMVISILLKIGTVKFFKNLQIGLIIQKQ